MANGIQNLDPSLWQRIKRMMNPLDDEGQMKTGGMDISPEALRTVAELGLDFTPGVGDVKAAFYDAPKSFKAAWESPTTLGKAGNTGAGILALASAIPFFGLPADVLRAIRKGKLSKADMRAIDEVREGSSQHLFNKESLGNAMRNNPWSHEIGVHMEPKAFLKLAAPLEKPRPGALESIEEAIRIGKPLDDIPLLNIKHPASIKARYGLTDTPRLAEVVGHEGRHRAMVFDDLDYKTMPVRLRVPDYGDTKGIRWGQQHQGPGEYEFVEEYPELLMRQPGKHIINLKTNRRTGEIIADEGRDPNELSAFLSSIQFPVPQDAYEILRGIRSLYPRNN